MTRALPFPLTVILCASNLPAQPAQSNAGEPLTFDVASVRPHDPNDHNGGLDTTPGQFRATNTP